ncbi:MAG: DUF423 domain-containing protein [Pseudomonadota bacterium]
MAWARGIAAAGALSGALAVGASAFGAHGLTRGFEAGTVTASQLRGFEVAADQHTIHALALLGAGLGLAALGASRWTVAAAMLFVFGTLAFAGPLYLYALTEAKALIRLVPVGGVGFILGWLCLAVGLLRARPRVAAPPPAAPRP